MIVASTPLAVLFHCPSYADGIMIVGDSTLPIISPILSYSEGDAVIVGSTQLYTSTVGGAYGSQYVDSVIAGLLGRDGCVAIIVLSWLFVGDCKNINCYVNLSKTKNHFQIINLLE